MTTLVSRLLWLVVLRKLSSDVSETRSTSLVVRQKDKSRSGKQRKNHVSFRCILSEFDQNYVRDLRKEKHLMEYPKKKVAIAFSCSDIRLKVTYLLFAKRRFFTIE